MILQIGFTKFWQIITLWDFILLPLYIVGIISYAYVIQNKRIAQEPEYKYFAGGLIFKMIGVLYFTYIYTVHYYGGDTTNYFQSSVYMLNLLYNKFWPFWSIMAGNTSMKNFSTFDGNTGYPMYYLKSNSFAVVRFTVPFAYFGCESYYMASLLIAVFTYTGVWRLFQVFVKEYPQYMNLTAIAILFMPSVSFWGSGVGKDSFMLSALGWFVYSFYSLVKRNKGEPALKHYIFIIFSVFIMISIKAFNFYAMGICIGLWFVFELIGKINNDVLRVLLYPFVFVCVTAVGLVLFMMFGNLAGGEYGSIDGMLSHALVVQQDLTREVYGENSFDIGAFEPTVPGILSKFPVATMAGLFRPYVWEANNGLMMLSALENVFLFFLTVYVLVTIGPRYFFQSFTRKPYILMLSLTFSILFAFSVGLVTANFGALVRYKIPLIPFYVAAMFIMLRSYEDRKKGKRNEPPPGFRNKH